MATAGEDSDVTHFCHTGMGQWFNKPNGRAFGGYLERGTRPPNRKVGEYAQHNQSTVHDRCAAGYGR